MKKKIMVLIFYMIAVISLTGCFDANELDELGISLILGFDVVEDKLLITAEVVDPQYSSSSSDTGEGSTVKYVQGIGNTVFEAFRDITLKFDRRIYAAHNKVLIFGEELARSGLITHIDQLFRDREQRESAFMLIAKGARAYEVMGVNSGLETVPANYILDLIKNINNNPKSIDTNIISYMQHYYHEGHHPIVGVIEKKRKNVIDKTSEDKGSEEYELSIIGSAIFRKDKLIGYLNGNDTKAVNYLLNNIENGIITFPIFNSSEEKVQSEGLPTNVSSVNVIKGKTKNDIEINGDKVILKTKINIRAALGELIAKTDVSNEEDIRRLEDACSKTVEVNIESAVKKVQQEYGTDIFGFGMAFHHKYPKQWEKIKENWDEIFKDAEFQIEVKTSIIRTGLINKPTI
ncbi:MAG: Ger(x)C family spore germination protein [Tissierellia bacterium]|nr:Ger(x)C family spore germination protein [Tissierellia bacterium]